MKTKIYKEINKLVILGIIKKELSEVYSLEMVIRSLQPRNGHTQKKNSDISKVVEDFRHLQTRLPHLNMIGYNSKKLPDAAKNYFIAALDLFGELITQRTDYTCSL